MLFTPICRSCAGAVTPSSRLRKRERCRSSQRRLTLKKPPRCHWQRRQHGKRGSRLSAHPDAKVLEELTTLIEANKITPIVSQTFPLMDVAQAHQQIETAHTRGKIVLKVAPERK